MIYIVYILGIKDEFNPHKIYCVSNKFNQGAKCLKIYQNDKDSIE